jgi:hypothetical protein
MVIPLLVLVAALSVFGGATAFDAGGGSPTIIPITYDAGGGSPTVTATVDDAGGGSPTHH